MLQGADRVNDELEVGYDQRFERNWTWVERFGRFMMIGFVLAAIGGFLGRGPFSHESASATGANLAIDFEPIARVQTPTQITLHLSNPTSDPTVEVFISTQLAEPMGLERILPQPLSEKAAGGGMLLECALPPGTRDGHVRLIIQPAGIGLIDEMAHVTGHPAVHWRQAVLP